MMFPGITGKMAERCDDLTTKVQTSWNIVGQSYDVAKVGVHHGKGMVKTYAVIRKGKELNKSIGSKSFHHFIQRLLVPSIRQQVAKPQVLMRSQQNCSKQEDRRYWIECTEYVWRSGKLVSGQRNGRSPHSSHFPRKAILNSVRITEQLLVSPMQARSFFRSYWK